MGYAVAINKAWEELAGLSGGGARQVKFFSDVYSVDFSARMVSFLPSQAAAKDFTAVLILHYAIRELKGLKPLANEWISFKELSGGEAYYPAFRKRAIDPIIRKYGDDPVGLYSNLDRLSGKKAVGADAGIVIEAFSGVPVMVLVWKADEEFSAEANLLFDRGISGLFSTEDIAVLSGYITKYV
ncbi:MAG: DUF3786 domain-containing protein [Candidatus Omnitrophica bacterium]|jgi:hypothetical protein|nr:DUF3786 domain-containing protein [Candidatus Omnitrophota bacterium]MDD5079335.1 DUF3786 domain-containing protein [Candidatus Omnitrophota bacterium]